MRLNLQHKLDYCALLTDFETSNTADDCYKLLTFSPGQLQQCHNYSIVNDQNCQLEKQFKISLSLLSSNDTKIRLDPSSSTTTIVIDDRRDEECCKLTFQINIFTCIHVTSCESGV